MWQLDPKEGWALKNWCFWTVVLEKTPESPLASKEIKQVNLKGDQPWIFIGRTDAETEPPVLSSSDMNRWFIGKVPDAGKDWGQTEKRTSQDEMAGSHHRCKEHEFGQVLEDSEGQGSLSCCSPWGHKESDMTGWLNKNIGICILLLRLPWWFCHKASTCNEGDTEDVGSISGSGRSLGGGHGNSLQYSCLEKFHGQRSLEGYSPWGCKETRLNDWTLTHATKENGHDNCGPVYT